MNLPRNHITLALSGLKGSLAVRSFHVIEDISELYELRVEFVTEDKVDATEVVHREGALATTRPSGRHFHGIVRSMTFLGRIGRFCIYQCSIVPCVSFLSLNKDFRIFQNISVVEAVGEILKENHISSDLYDFRLVKGYEKRRNITQYGESDFHFIARLLEEEGIFYFFEHHPDRHVLVCADEATAYLKIAAPSSLACRVGEGMVADEETVTSFTFSREVRPGRFTQTNYNFKRPSLSLTVTHVGSSHQEHELFDFPGAYNLPDAGQRLARVRLEEQKTLQETVRGSSNCPRFIPGHTFELSEHHIEDLNVSYLLVSVQHTGTQDHVVGEYAGIGGDYTYSNEFLAIPASVTLRPARTTAKPIAHGPQTAIVTGAEGEEIWPDQEGHLRIKVQFPWDRRGKRDAQSSCWLRVAHPWGGAGWGAQFLPRVGDEVLVAFQNGDPDRPIVIGSVFNAANMPLYDLPLNKSQSGIRTRSTPNGTCDNFNELRFEDQKGSEEVYLQAEKDWNVLVKNNDTREVGNDETLHVAHNRLKTVGVDQMEQVGGSHTGMIGGNKTVTVGQNQAETVAINSMETVGVAKELTIGGGYQVSVGAAMNETVLGAKCEEVGVTKQVLVGSHMTERVAGNRAITVGENLSATVAEGVTVKARTIVMEADEELILKSGNATISLRSDGAIVVKGANLTELATGEIVIKGARTSVN